MRSTAFCLPCNVEAQVGTSAVTLFGLLHVENDSASFIVGAPPPRLPSALVAPRPLTTRIDKPLGLPGVALEEMRITGTISQRGCDLAIAATAEIGALSLFGAVVLEDSTARLVFVRLQKDKPLTLTAVLNDVVGGAAAWAAEVTDQFAFAAGALSMLVAPDRASADYHYVYQDDVLGRLDFKPGFRAMGDFLLFDHPFQVEMGVANAIDRTNLPSGYTPHATDVTVVGRAAQPLTFDFGSLGNPYMGIARLTVGSHLLFGTDALNLFDTSRPLVLNASYDVESGAFTGAVDVAVFDFDLTLRFSWNRANGFRITDINGLGTREFPLMAQFESILNTLRDRGCNAVVGDWLNGVAKSTVTPALNDSPYRDGEWMRVPLMLTYNLSFDGHGICTIPIVLPLALSPPSSLDDLPGALWQSITDSAEEIAKAVLEDPNAYYALALEVGKRAGAAAFARFICRFFSEGLKDLAKTLAKSAITLSTDTIGAVAELAGMTVMVTLYDVSVVMNLFEEAWDEIKKLFGGGDSKKDEAEGKIRDIRATVEEALDNIDAKIAEAGKRLSISQFTLGLDGADDNLDVVGSIVWTQGYRSEAEEGGKLTLNVDYLTGRHDGEAGPEQVIVSQAIQTTSLRYPLADIVSRTAPGQGYGLNARVSVALSGVTFMDRATDDAVGTAIAELRSLDNGVANDFAAMLERRRAQYRKYNEAIVVGGYVYAVSDVPYGATVGASRIGVNTRVPS